MLNDFSQKERERERERKFIEWACAYVQGVLRMLIYNLFIAISCWSVN